MNLRFSNGDCSERAQQSRWLHQLYEESKTLSELTVTANEHYLGLSRSMKAIAATYENVNALLASSQHYYIEVDASARVGVSSNVKRFTTLVRTLYEAPECKDVSVLLKAQAESAEELRRLVKRGFAPMKQRDECYASVASTSLSARRRHKRMEADSKVGKEVRGIYAEATRLLERHCTGQVRAWTASSGAVIQLVHDHHMRSLLAGVGTAEAVLESASAVTGVVQSPEVARDFEAQRQSVTRPASRHESAEGRYGQNRNEYVPTNVPEHPSAYLSLPALARGRQQESVGLALEFTAAV